MAIALHYTRGRLRYETHEDLQRLSDQLMDLLDEASVVERAIGRPLRLVRNEPAVHWHSALEVVGLRLQDADLILWHASIRGSRETSEIRRVMSGLPWSNPLTQVWELRQLSALYQAAVGILEDAVCDLADELVGEWRDLSRVAPLTSSRTAGQLLLRIDENRKRRGGPGDGRRQVGQRYEACSIRPSLTGSVPVLRNSAG